MDHTPSRRTKPETGQAIVLIALGFIVLLAFTGIVVDVARVFTQRGELRRAVDAAGLAATGQFRTGAGGQQIRDAAINIIRAHGIGDPNVVIETCGAMGEFTQHNQALCPPPGKPMRKLVFVKATAPVPMLFLQLIGIPNVTVAGESTAEAASVDVVLVLDTSESQAYDAPSGWAFTGDPGKGCKPSDVGIDKVSACTKACNDDPNKPCFPLQKVKDAAKAFVDQMYSGYDRVAVVSYARASESAYTLGTDLNAAKVAIDGLRAFDNGGVVCSFLGTAPWKCGSSNPGGAMKRAAWELSGKPNDIREDSLWVTVFLSSGGMNATDPIPSSDPESAEWGFCPAKDPANDPASKDDPPPCRDQLWSVHHEAPTMSTPSYWYDSEDYAFDNATYLGKRPVDESNPDGLSVLIYTIALGQKAVCTTGTTYSPGPPVTCGNWNPAYEDLDSHLPNTGELFLRYAADIGDNGKLDPPGSGVPNPCYSALSGMQCGNYYFAPGGDDLKRIFLEIAGRIFTRLTG